MKAWTICLVATFACLPAVSSVSAAASNCPNVLLITADDLGNQLSCYGETRIRTPHLDALAVQGVRFANAYVAQSSCSSSRAALLTGRWPHQNGQYGLAHLGFRMHPGQRNLPALLKEAGYRTGIIGKLHVEPAVEFPFTEMSFHTANYFMPQRTVRDDRYKLLLNLAPRADRAQVELFDLQTDPEETKNLAGDRELDSTQRRLERALDRWREQTGDPLVDPARLERWRRIADEWKKSAPRLEGGDYPDVARVPQGGLELLK
jgi:arylsulfatase A-like enzyme